MPLTPPTIARGVPGWCMLDRTGFPDRWWWYRGNDDWGWVCSEAPKPIGGAIAESEPTCPAIGAVRGAAALEGGAEDTLELCCVPWLAEKAEKEGGWAVVEGV